MSRLLLVGWDAADWKVIDPLLARGEMPHLARLLQQGVRWWPSHPAEPTRGARSKIEFPLNEGERCRRCRFWRDLCPAGECKIERRIS